MEREKGVKKVSLFSAEAVSLLTDENLQLRLGNERLLIEEQETKVDEEITRTISDVQCTSCHVTFANREEQVEHYHLDWHRHNLKRRLKGLSSFSQDEFERLSDDLSSISGSESDSEEDIKPQEEEEDVPTKIQGSPLLMFSTSDGTIHAVYRCLLSHTKDIGMSVSELLHAIADLTKPQVWIILMRSGGHFAGAVFRGSNVLDHKTYHRYTVRAKRGTIQSSRDAHQGSHKPKSAGASLRRYNEAALEQEIDDLLLSWKPYIDKATAVFIRAPKHNKHAFTTGRNSPLTFGDPRIRRIPFITRRPTFSQIKAVQLKLATVYSGLKYPSPIAARKTQTKTDVLNYTETLIDVSEIHTDVSETHTDAPETYTNVLENKAETSPFNESDEERDEFLSETCPLKLKKRRRKKKEKKEVIDPLVMELHTYCRHGDVEALLKLLRKAGYQSISSSTDQSVVSSIDQPVASSTDQPVASSTDQPVASSTDQPVVSSTDQPVVSSIDQPVASSIDQPVVSSTDQSVASSTDQPVVSSTDQSVASSTDQPVASSTDQPVVSSINQPTFSDLEFKLDVNATIDNITALHVASSSGHVDVIRVLLLHGANPIIKDGNGKVPYVVARDKPTRDTFRRFMNNYPGAYDYTTAQIPSPLTDEMESVRKAKKVEKKKIQRKLQKERKSEVLITEELKGVESSQQQIVGVLTDREKRALAAEKRMTVQTPTSFNVTKYGTCDWCGTNLCGVVPFERLQYKYCKIECVREHRQNLNKN